MCGGWWAKIVNEDTTCCVGGVDAEECYIAEIDLGDLCDEVVSFFLSLEGNLVLGSVHSEEYDLGTFGYLTAVGAWYRSGGKFEVDHPGPVFARLVENGFCYTMVPQTCRGKGGTMRTRACTHSRATFPILRP